MAAQSGCRGPSARSSVACSCPEGHGTAGGAQRPPGSPAPQAPHGLGRASAPGVPGQDASWPPASHAGTRLPSVRFRYLSRARHWEIGGEGCSFAGHAVRGPGFCSWRPSSMALRKASRPEAAQGPIAFPQGVGLELGEEESGLLRQDPRLREAGVGLAPQELPGLGRGPPAPPPARPRFSLGAGLQWCV